MRCHPCLYTYLCSCLCTCLHTCLYSCLCTCRPYACLFACLHTCLHTCLYTCLCTDRTRHSLEIYTSWDHSEQKMRACLPCPSYSAGPSCLHASFIFHPASPTRGFLRACLCACEPCMPAYGPVCLPAGPACVSVHHLPMCQPTSPCKHASLRTLRACVHARRCISMLGKPWPCA